MDCFHGYRGWSNCGWAPVALLPVLLVQRTKLFANRPDINDPGVLPSKRTCLPSVRRDQTNTVTFALREHETLIALTKFGLSREGNTSPGGYIRGNDTIFSSDFVRTTLSRRGYPGGFAYW
jgi:hypothetical protein